MNYSVQFICLIGLTATLAVQAQEAKKAMTFEELAKWERISERTISNDGKWITCKTEPWLGDASIYLYNHKGEEKGVFKPAAKAEFSPTSLYVLITQTPASEDVEALKLKKAPEDQMPMNSLQVLNLSGKRETIDSLKSYKLSETADWLAYQRGNKSDSTLYIRSLDGSQKVSFPTVSEFGFAKKGNILYYVSDSSLYTYTPQQGNIRIKEEKGVFKKITFNEEGNKLAFLFCADKDSTATGSALYLSDTNKPARLVAEKGNRAFPSSWVISENGNLYFSENTSRLFFGTAPAPKEKDTAQLAENRPDVQIWKWDEGIQYTQQIYNKTNDLKRSYTAVYNLNTQNIIQLATEEIPNLIIPDKGNAPVALLSSSIPYETERMWEGRTHYDIYSINLENGNRRLIKKAANTNMRLSPKGKYAFWYSEPDSAWYTYSFADTKEYQLTTPQTFVAWDEENDVPDFPAAYGSAGWTTDDEYLLISDRYDIWKFSPTGNGNPINLTGNGREKQLAYQLLKLDKEQVSIK